MALDEIDIRSLIKPLKSAELYVYVQFPREKGYSFI